MTWSLVRIQVGPLSPLRFLIPLFVEAQLQESPQAPGPGRVPQFPKRLGLDLADPLTGDMKDGAHLFEGARAAVPDTEAQPQDLRLPLGQRFQHRLHLLLEHRVGGGVGR